MVTRRRRRWVGQSFLGGMLARKVVSRVTDRVTYRNRPPARSTLQTLQSRKLQIGVTSPSSFGDDDASSRDLGSDSDGIPEWCVLLQNTVLP